MKTKSLFFQIFTFLYLIGILANSGAVYAQGEETTQPNAAPSISFIEPQQNITVEQGEKVNIVWEDEDADDNALIDIAYDVDADPTNAENYVWIVQDLAEDPDGEGDRYEWDTTEVPAGTYYIWASISDSSNATVYALAAGTVTIQVEQAPVEEPTQVPTAEPTQVPTAEPTQIPTEEPSPEPTQVPTAEPTQIPTEEPSPAPTQVPTIEPTQTPTQTPTQPVEEDYFQVETVRMGDGTVLSKAIIHGPAEAPLGYEREVIELPTSSDGSIQRIQQLAALTVPAFSWSFGCSATSAAMIAGYYDRNGYSNMYTGPTNGGVMPLDNSSWPDWVDSGGDTRHQCPLSATHKGLDGRTTRGHVDDYWVEYGSTATDPWVAYGSEHAYGDCTADYMKTNQNQHGYDNSDGATSFYYYSNGDTLTCDKVIGLGIEDDGTAGFRDFFESRGYTVTDCYMKVTNNQASNGFTFAQYKAEIDAGYPVMIHVQGHTMVGVGYQGTNTVILHDTWDYSNHTMTWGGSYSGMEMWGVSIVHLKAPIPTPSSPSGTISDTTPTYTWSKVIGAAKYQVQLYKGSTLIYANMVSSSVCGTTNCTSTPTTALSAGDYQWRVGAYVSGAWQTFSTYKTFTLKLTPTPVSPSGTISDTTPTYTWSKLSTATKYQYQLYKGSTLIYAKTVTSSVCGTTNCTSTPSNALSTGSYKWRVGAYVSGAWQTFSAYKTFTLTLTPTPSSPSGTISDTTPTYTWSTISAATKYQYQLYKGSTLIYAKTVTSSACGSTTCTNTPTTVLSLGTYQWRVGAYVGGAWKAFSAYKTFTLTLTPTPVSPSGTISDTTPTYTWTKINEATKYQYQLYQGSTLIYTKTVPSSVCGTTNCTSTPSNVLSSGTYQWRVGAYVGGAWKTFSAYKTFTVN